MDSQTTVTAAATTAAPSPVDGAHGFDFLFGSWNVHNRRLQQRLTGCDTWDEFEARSICRPILGGAGNEDEFISPHLPGYVGASLRLYDPQARQWSIYWVDNRSVVLQPPVVGSFACGSGVFAGADVFGGKAILVRYLWSRIDSPAPRWEQAFSADGGATWETNWVMEFQRIAAAASE